MRTEKGSFSFFKSLAFCLLGAISSSAANAAIQENYLDVDALDANGNAVPGCKLRYRSYYDPVHKPATGYHPMLAIHGGGWTGGEPWIKDPSTNTLPFTIQYFTQAGYVIVAPAYRLLPVLNTTTSTQGCGRPSVQDQKLDIKNAFFLTVFLNSLNTDVARNEKMVIYGESAGGHLAVDFAAKISADLKPFLGGVVAVGAPLHFSDILSNAKSSNPPYKNTNRTMTLGTAKIPLTADDTTIYWPWILFGPGPMLSYYWNGGRATGSFVNASATEAIIKENTLSNYINSSSIPLYLVVGNDDGIVAPEQSQLICKAFGTPTIIENTAAFKRARCGGTASKSYMEVIMNGGHVPTVNKSELHNRLNDWLKLRR